MYYSVTAQRRLYTRSHVRYTSLHEVARPLHVFTRGRTPATRLYTRSHVRYTSLHEVARPLHVFTRGRTSATRLYTRSHVRYTSLHEVARPLHVFTRGRTSATRTSRGRLELLGQVQELKYGKIRRIFGHDNLMPRTK